MSNADEIMKLKELLDKDVITQEEFDKKKKELLNIKDNTEKQSQNNNNSKKSFLSKLGIENNITLTSKKNKKKSSPVGVIVLLVFIVFVIVVGTSTDRQYEKINHIKELLNQYSISYEEVDNILKKCGFNDYTLEKSIDNDEVADSNGFKIQENDIIAFLDIKDGKIYSISYSDKILYENGAIQHTLSDYIMTFDEQSNTKSTTMELINSILKSPSTAKYAPFTEWKFSKSDNTIITQSYVDSQNGFGATIRSTFQVTYTNGKVTSLIFDGTEYIK